MAQLWGGRFTKEVNQLVFNFNASLSFDQKLYRQDIEGSIAHVTMLARQGILTVSERDSIIDGLRGILADGDGVEIDNGIKAVVFVLQQLKIAQRANIIA